MQTTKFVETLEDYGMKLYAEHPEVKKQFIAFNYHYYQWDVIVPILYNRNNDLKGDFWFDTEKFVDWTFTNKADNSVFTYGADSKPAHHHCTDLMDFEKWIEKTIKTQVTKWHFKDYDVYGTFINDFNFSEYNKSIKHINK